MLASARRSVSCTRSSARSTLPHSEIAKARRLGTAARMASRTDGSRLMIAVSCLRPCRYRCLRACHRDLPRAPRFRSYSIRQTVFGRDSVSTSQVVALHLPFLRRYARALTGNQSSGDAYVAEVLEALIEDPGILEKGGDARVALYRAFTKVWNAVAVNGRTDPGAAWMPAEERLSHLTPRARQAFLLVA